MEDEDRLFRACGGRYDDNSPRMLDALVAWRVIGWKPHLCGNYPWQMEPPPELVESTSLVRCVPHYTTDATADYSVLERIRDAQHDGMPLLNWEEFLDALFRDVFETNALRIRGTRQYEVMAAYTPGAYSRAALSALNLNLIA